MTVTIEVENSAIPFGLYSLVKAAHLSAVRYVRSKPGTNLLDRRMDFIAADLVGDLPKYFPEYDVYRGGHHVAIFRKGSDATSARVILIVEREG